MAARFRALSIPISSVWYRYAIRPTLRSSLHPSQVAWPSLPWQQMNGPPSWRSRPTCLLSHGLARRTGDICLKPITGGLHCKGVCAIICLVLLFLMLIWFACFCLWTCPALPRWRYPFHLTVRSTFSTLSGHLWDLPYSCVCWKWAFKHHMHTQTAQKTKQLPVHPIVIDANGFALWLLLGLLDRCWPVGCWNIGNRGCRALWGCFWWFKL